MMKLLILSTASLLLLAASFSSGQNVPHKTPEKSNNSISHHPQTPEKTNHSISHHPQTPEKSHNGSSIPHTHNETPKPTIHNDDGHSCRLTSDCWHKIGFDSTCNSQGRCVCQAGFEEKLHVSEGGAVSKVCKKLFVGNCNGTDFTCILHFSTHSHCAGSGSCTCDSGYYFDSQRWECVKGDSGKDNSCRTVSDCWPKVGLRSLCNSHGRCVCQMGFEEVLHLASGSNGTSFSTSCQNFACKGSDMNCYIKFGVRSHCHADHCSCDARANYNADKGECVREYDDYLYVREIHVNYPVIIGLAVGGVTLIVSLIIAICCCVKRKRRMAEQRKQALARDRAAHTAASHQQSQQTPSAPMQTPQPQQNPGAFI